MLGCEDLAESRQHRGPVNLHRASIALLHTVHTPRQIGVVVLCGGVDGAAGHSEHRGGQPQGGGGSTEVGCCVLGPQREGNFRKHRLAQRV